MKKYLIFLGLSLALFLPAFALAAPDYTGEQIVYELFPFGRAEFNDRGLTDFAGRKLRLITFHTRVPGFEDTEYIYSDKDSYLPVRVERDISWPVGKEYIVEEYDQKNFTYILRNFKDKKKVEEQVFNEKGPIQNAILLPFYLRTIPDLAVGWTLTVRFPEEFIVKLVSLEEIKVPAGRFQAYHFISSPHKFEIWISKDNPRVPLKIKDIGIVGYTMQMKEHIFKNRTGE